MADPTSPKPIWQSKTFWVNALTGVAAVASLPGIALVPPTYMQYVLLASSVANVGLRLVTTQPVSMTNQAP